VSGAIVHARTVKDARDRARAAPPALPATPTIQQIAEHRAAALRLKDWRLKVSLVSGPTTTRARVDSKDATIEIHAGPAANRDLVRELVGLHFAAFGPKHAARAAKVADVIAAALVAPSAPRLRARPRPAALDAAGLALFRRHLGLPATAPRADIHAALLTHAARRRP